MGKIIASSAVSLDGYSAGTDAGPEYPLGVHGERLHAWMGEPGTESKFAKNIAAVIIGNTMFRCGEGPWGDENPWGPPIYVLTHTPHDPVYRQGEIAFRFVTNGIESALEQAKMTAGDKDILIGGGANVIQQYLNAGHLQELEISLVPITLGAGIRLIDGVSDKFSIEPIDVIPTLAVTHLRYRIRPGSTVALN